MYRKNIDLVAAVGVAVLECIAVAIHLAGPVLILLGIGLFAVPGYVWSEVLLGRAMANLERIVVAAGLAFILPVLGGLALYAAGVSLHRAAWVGLLATASITGALILVIRRRGTTSVVEGSDGKRLRPSIPHAAVYAIAGVIAMGSVALAVRGAEAQRYPGYTRLWLTPFRNEPLLATLGVTNQQDSTLEYKLVLRENGRVNGSWNITLATGDTWQRTVNYTVNYAIVANLYRLPNLGLPYREVDNGEKMLTKSSGSREIKAKDRAS
jgi:hypothetical protein